MVLGITLIYITGGCCVFFSLLVSLHLLYQHFTNFTKPEYQRYICRILLMVPVYAETSWVSMMFPEHRLYWNMIRDCYEAFVIYNFTMLLVNYVGGERKLSINLEMKDRIQHPWPFNLFFLSFQPGTTFLRLVKVGTLQFVFFRPFSSVLVIIFSNLGVYHDSYFGVDDSYIYIFALSNLSFSISDYLLHGIFLNSLSGTLRTAFVLRSYRRTPRALQTPSEVPLHQSCDLFFLLARNSSYFTPALQSHPLYFFSVLHWVRNYSPRIPYLPRNASSSVCTQSGFWLQRVLRRNQLESLAT